MCPILLQAGKVALDCLYTERMQELEQIDAIQARNAEYIGRKNRHRVNPVPAAIGLCCVNLAPAVRADRKTGLLK